METTIMKNKARIIAYYLPQYHPIPENDKYWGKGFTEWTNVASAKPQFRGHYQPRIPADLGFYDLRLSEVREAQAQMAKESGIEGFMYWHYWFGNGKQLLERPFNEVLKSGKPDFPFCLGWANHTWATKTWTARENIKHLKSAIIVEQLYPGIQDYTEHFYSVLPAFKDKRYIYVDGKPFFLIYNILDIPDAQLFIDTWQSLARKNGLKGIHFVGNIMGNTAENNKEKVLHSGVDAMALSNLTLAQKKSVGLLQFYINKIRVKMTHIGIERYKYSDIIKNYHSEYELKDNVYPIVFPQLDRTPRAGKQAIVLTGSNPKLFKQYLQDTLNVIKDKQYEHRIIIINAWNEWGEGNYLEPDMKYGRGYLDSLKEVIVDK